jgi:hypothetical protein
MERTSRGRREIHVHWPSPEVDVGVTCGSKGLLDYMGCTTRWVSSYRDESDKFVPN